MNRTHPNVIKPPSKPLDSDSNVVGLFPSTNPQLTTDLTLSKSAPTAQNSLQPDVTLGEALSATALASTCRTSVDDPLIGAPFLGDHFSGSISVQGMAASAVLPPVSTYGLIHGTLQATGLDLVILVDAPTSANSSGFQPEMAHPPLKPGMERTSIENPLVHLAASIIASLQLVPT
ncbi:hypothetical protein Adt_41711 [Abeliophyllum distichum]|uniref:Uncharacterized protein n=1 Tax=Abeliophyllum distichum TaxID=126358 RepID=A0ABD1PPM0_9LAMI